ncbi:MAG: HAMP domain-containing histidine kinase, partial [Methylocystaceae bacterium]|nr:HAMP domain-containing histidine kinase [Methylocystaceae bacterium]
FYFFYISNRNIKGLREWTIGMIIMAIGFWLVFMRGSIPNLISICIANAFTIFGSACFMIGIVNFLNVKYSRYLIFTVAGLLWLPFIFLYQDFTLLNIRIHIITLSTVIFFGSSSYYLLKEYMNKRTNSLAITGISCLITAISCVARSAYIFLHETQSDAYLKQNLESSAFLSSLNAIFLSVITVSFILLLAGILMLIADHLKEDLEHAMAEQSKFWSMIAHEFRTPLGTINSSAQIVQAFVPKSEKMAQEEIDRIKQTSLRLSGLVDKCLLHDWFASTSIQKHETLFDLQDLIQKLSFEYDIKFKDDIHEPVQMLGDTYLLSVAFSSLIDNALKYGKTRDACYISCSVHQKHICVDVFDDGEGIPPKEQNLIFDKFYRMKKHSKHNGGGLGLYITRKILDYHNAHVCPIYSNGSIFRVTFPNETV